MRESECRPVSTHSIRPGSFYAPHCLAFSPGLRGFAVARRGRRRCKVDYDISLAGLPLGTADLSSTFDGPKYKMQAAAKLSGLAKMLTGGKGAATASGAISGRSRSPPPSP